MPYLATSQEWLEQSALLLQARPTTAKIVTRYTVENANKKLKQSRTSRSPQPTTATRFQGGSKNQPDAAKPSPGGSATTPQPASSQSNVQQPPAVPRAVIVLRTYDPVSGVCLKYSTNKAAEVGRLLSSLGRLARGMCGLSDAAAEEGSGQGSGPATEAQATPPARSGGGPGPENGTTATAGRTAASTASTAPGKAPAKIAGAASNPSAGQSGHATGAGGGGGGGGGTAGQGKKRKKGGKR